METVGIRELKNKLSAYVRKVEAGDVVIVTDRGRIVAELVPPGWQRTRGRCHSGLLELARRDGLRLPTRPGSTRRCSMNPAEDRPRRADGAGPDRLGSEAIVTVYAETSAVLAWLLDEPAGPRVAAFLRPPAPSSSRTSRSSSVIGRSSDSPASIPPALLTPTSSDRASPQWRPGGPSSRSPGRWSTAPGRPSRTTRSGRSTPSTSRRRGRPRSSVGGARRPQP